MQGSNPTNSLILPAKEEKVTRGAIKLINILDYFYLRWRRIAPVSYWELGSNWERGQWTETDRSFVYFSTASIKSSREEEEDVFKRRNEKKEKVGEERDERSKAKS